ncbi:sugar nucleotide-binding protein [Methylobacterium sp. WSM2598]|uniref:sugar nucleotide-binding protein n=1 Tax=Methylobacterium sp. WSM2598 TaxID=398261 RepID=UPI0012F6BA93|nr:sugar nucleotide-binding protein [Methylobacterium sp. WSM2598]
MLEAWGGIACGIGRFADAFREPLARTGREPLARTGREPLARTGREPLARTGRGNRRADRDALAAPGIAALRAAFPRKAVAPDDPDRRDGSRHDDRPARGTRPGRAAAGPPGAEPGDPAPPPEAARLVVLGRAGAYGAAIARLCEARGLSAAVVDPEALPDDLAAQPAWAVIDPTGLPLAAAAKRYPGGSFRADIRRGERVAGLCAGVGARLLAFSSDLVFDGRTGSAAVESDPVRPSGAYGASEAAREAGILGAHPGALVARTSVVFGLPDASDEAGLLLAGLGSGSLRRFLRPEIVSPTYLPDLVHAALGLLAAGEAGLWHLVNAGETTWAGFATRLTLAAGLPRPAPGFRAPADHRNTALASERGRPLPPLAGAVARYAAERRRAPARLAAE